MTTRFDTLRYMRRLEDAGVPQQQAEAHIETLAEALEEAFGDVVRGSDLASVATDLKQTMSAGFREQHLKWEAYTRERDLKSDADSRERDLKWETESRARDLKWEAESRERDLKWEAESRERDLRTEARFQQMDTKWEGKFNVLYFGIGTSIALHLFVLGKLIFF